MNTLELTKELIKIPSFVESEFNENNLAEFIIEYIQENIPWLQIFREPIEGTDRFNVIAYNSTKPKIIFVSHMDTVKPNGDTKLRLKPLEKNGKLFGLGSVDMKSGLACSLIAAKKSDPNIPIALVFDCDEEYYFSGIKQFIFNFKSGKLPLEKSNKPELVIFPEPSDLTIVPGCRGCIEIAFRVIGKTAHAGRPDAGINAIEKGVELVQKLKAVLTKGTTVNLAGLNGGVLQNGEIKLQANAISDVADLLLDIRTVDPMQSAELIIEQAKVIAKKLNVGLENTQINLDLQCYKNNSQELKKLEKAMQKVIGKITYQKEFTTSGYGELAMLGAQLGWNTVNFGPGPGIKSHKSDEALNIEDLEIVVNVYKELIKLLGAK
jgi:acetylornithine deacetylase/succinyl-diaminopimelate desuccinylase-like protein